MTADISVTIATSHTTSMGALTSAHPSLLGRTVFRHTFHQKFSPNHIHAHISLNITQIYNTSLYTNLYLTITEVHTSNYIYGSAGNVHEQYAAYLILHRLNHILQHYQPCGQVFVDTSLWAI
jgi:hypothetical protein